MNELIINAIDTLWSIPATPDDTLCVDPATLNSLAKQLVTQERLNISEEQLAQILSSRRTLQWLQRERDFEQRQLARKQHRESSNSNNHVIAELYLMAASDSNELSFTTEEFYLRIYLENDQWQVLLQIKTALLSEGDTLVISSANDETLATGEIDDDMEVLTTWLHSLEPQQYLAQHGKKFILKRGD